MGMQSQFLLLFLLAQMKFIVADVQFNYPQAGSVVTGGQIFNVTFGESGNRPGLGELSTYVMNVYSGSNLQPCLMRTFPQISGNFGFNRGMRIATFKPINTNGPNTTNAYFIGINSTFKYNTTISVINYSPRFTISNQNGQATNSINDANDELSGTAGPQRFFTCNNIPCIPPASLVDRPPSNLSCTPATPPCPTRFQKKSKSSDSSGLKSYIGVFAFIGVFVVVLIIGVFVAVRLEKRDGKTHFSLGRSWWDQTQSQGLDLGVAPLKTVKKSSDANKKERRSTASSGYDTTWLAELEASRPKSVYRTPTGYLMMDKRQDERLGRDSLSTVREIEEKEFWGRKEKRAGRVFDERVRSRFYGTGAV